MRTSELSTQTSEIVPVIAEPSKPTTSSYWARLVTINWEKVILFANTALILAGIGFAFFLKFPMASLFLGLYGVIYIYLNIHVQRLAEKTKVVSTEVPELKKERDAAKQALEIVTKDKERVEGQLSEMSKSEGNITHLAEKTKALEKKNLKLKKENKQLEAQEQSTKESLKKIEKIGTTNIDKFLTIIADNARRGDPGAVEAVKKFKQRLKSA